LSQASMQGVCTWVSQRGNLVNYYAKALAII
jgi:ribosomal protein S15P/S13E